MMPPPLANGFVITPKNNGKSGTADMSRQRYKLIDDNRIVCI